MCERSETIDKIGAALAKAQAGMTVADKDAKNPHFRSDYATLASVMEAVRPALSENGIAIFQDVGTGDGNVLVTTHLIHSSGQWLASTISAKPQKPDAQGIGSTVTYLRRYGLMAAAGIAPGDDDDGNAASGVGTAKGSAKPRPQQQKKVESKPEPTPTDANTSAEDKVHAYWRKIFDEGSRTKANVCNTARTKSNALDPARARLGMLAGVAAADNIEELALLDEANHQTLELLNKMGEEGMMIAGEVRQAIADRFRAFNPAEAAE